MMHSSHLPLQIWFLAAHIIANHSNIMSVLQLQAQLGLGSYKSVSPLTNAAAVDGQP